MTATPFFPLLVLEGGHFLNLFFSEESSCIRDVNSAIDMVGANADFFSLRKKGSAFNSLKNYRTADMGKTFDFLALHPKKIKKPSKRFTRVPH